MFTCQIALRGMSTPRRRHTPVTRRGYYPKPYQQYVNQLSWLLAAEHIPKQDYHCLAIEFHFSYAPSIANKNKIDGLPCRQLYDNDNLAKGIMDALEKLGVLNNDRQISQLNVKKYWTTSNDHIIITLDSIDNYE